MAFRLTGDVEYAELTKYEQEFYDKVDQMFGDKWTHEEVIDFMEAYAPRNDR